MRRKKIKYRLNFIAAASIAFRRCWRTHTRSLQYIAMHRGENARELNESVTACVFSPTACFAGSVEAVSFRGNAAARRWIIIYFCVSRCQVAVRETKRGSDGIEREGKRARESGWKSEGRGCFGERRARVIITDFPDLILRTVTRHNSLTQIAHERM